LDPNWSYTPTYLIKMQLVREFIDRQPPKARILDAGCGEGVLVEEFTAVGRNIVGLDLNYESDIVKKGNILSCPYDDGYFDVVLMLDVFEHLFYTDQPKALAEISRLLKPAGRLAVTVPNLAHLNSRFVFVMRGRLDRTDSELNHPGERPYRENRRLFEDAGFELLEERGATLTLPFIYRHVICRWPKRLRWLHDSLQIFASPSLSMLTFQIWRKPE